MRGQCGAQQEVGGGGGWGTETRHTGPTQSEDRDRGGGVREGEVWRGRGDLIGCG